MKRREFLRKLFGIGLATAAMTVPGVSKTKEEDTFTLDEAFIQCDGNKNLYYVKKDSKLNQELMKAIGDHYLPTDKFGCYYPVNNQFLSIKDNYSIDDFAQLILLLNDKREKFQYFCDGRMKDEKIGLLCLIKDNKGKFYKLELFEAFRNGMYGPK